MATPTKSKNKSTRDRTRKFLSVLNRWEHTGAGVDANAGELPHLEAPRTKLRRLLDEARSLTVEQSTLTARKQEISKRLQEVIRQGDTLADFLRTGAREHFGNGSEKLIEFGFQPFRARASSKAPATPAPEEPEAPNPTPTPEAKT